MKRSKYAAAGLSLGGILEMLLCGENEQENKTIKAEGKPAPSVYRVAVGVSDRREVVSVQLFENRILICGSSGSGKSVVANQILNEIFRIPVEQRIVALVDLKGGIEIQPWIELADANARDAKYANLIISNIYREMTKRQDILRSLNAKKLKPSEKFPLIVLFIDELAEIAADKTGDKITDEYNRESMVFLKRIFRLGRATGIVPIVCLQRPDSSILSGDLKNNIETSIVGKVRSAVDTKTIFGDSDTFPAHNLTGHWFYYVKGNKAAKFKTPYVPSVGDLSQEWNSTIAQTKRPPSSRGKFLYFPKEIAKNAKKDEAKNEKKTKRAQPRKKAEENAKSFGF